MCFVHCATIKYLYKLFVTQIQKVVLTVLVHKIISISITIWYYEIPLHQSENIEFLNPLFSPDLQCITTSNRYCTISAFHDRSVNSKPFSTNYVKVLTVLHTIDKSKFLSHLNINVSSLTDLVHRSKEDTVVCACVCFTLNEKRTAHMIVVDLTWDINLSLNSYYLQDYCQKHFLVRLGIHD